MLALAAGKGIVLLFERRAKSTSSHLLGYSALFCGFSKHIVCSDPLKLHAHPKRQPTGHQFYKCTEDLANEAANKGIFVNKGDRLCHHCRMTVTRKVSDSGMLK